MEYNKILDHYRICRKDRDDQPWELGRGGMGVTYLAEDINLRRKVALKVINSEAVDAAAREKFEREAQAAAALRQRNVATVYHLGTDKDYYFYAMEYIEGETAEAWVMKKGPMPLAPALAVGLQVSRALAAAQRQGLNHGDIKPSNLMLSIPAPEDGPWPLVKVIDFGLANLGLDDESAFYGTAEYASPEQARQQPRDIRSDIYSLGCTVWFLLTGEAPFTGPLATVFAKHFEAQPPFEKLLGFPKSVRRLLSKMLAKDPSDRPPGPLTLAKQFEKCLKRARRPHPFGKILAAACLTPKKLRFRPEIGSSLLPPAAVALETAPSWKRFHAIPPLPRLIAGIGVALLVVGSTLAAVAVLNGTSNTGQTFHLISQKSPDVAIEPGAEVENESEQPASPAESSEAPAITELVQPPPNLNKFNEKPPTGSHIDPVAERQFGQKLPAGTKLARFQGVDKNDKRMMSMPGEASALSVKPPGQVSQTEESKRVSKGKSNPASRRITKRHAQKHIRPTVVSTAKKVVVFLSPF